MERMGGGRLTGWYRSCEHEPPVGTSQGEAVLQITNGAATFLSELRRGQDVPETYGLRIYPESTEQDEVTVALGFTDAPADGDHVTEHDGLRVFVAPELAAPLDEAAIDVTADEEAPRLVFRPQGELQN